ncbi:uncharacterized protein [Physcomitrium patens]|uniref:Uncharacterized protein n=1 Tax=Physcomitrium patens TaxID=3218 RepID=A0A2K1KJH7_PHYPA|nr:uncharacterized protein LOC112282125 [Physcomitrium patens]PNR53931.1 hypothetical protein PHYPA_007606 [Physcomitrium patens]|eukprot:XP_024375140.1 uncharacterized protein LOC112282125 [Physcomitrella patens]
MADMARSSIDSMWKYSYEGSKHICTLAKKVITFMFQSWTRGFLCLLLLGSLPFLAPVILVTMMVGGAFVVPLLCAVTAYYVLFRRFPLPIIMKRFSSPKPHLRMEDLDTYAEEYRNRGASIGTPYLDYEGTCEETLDSDSEVEIVEEDPASEADAAIAKPDMTKEAEARPAEPEVFVDGATPTVQEKEVLPLVVSETLWENEQIQGVAEEIESKVDPRLESAEPFMKQQTLAVRSEPVEPASSVGDVIPNAGTVAVQEVASNENVTPLEEVNPEKTEMLEVPELDEKVIEVFVEETTSSEIDASIAELDVIKEVVTKPEEASIVLEKDVEFPLIMSAPALIEKEDPEVVKELEAVAVLTMESEDQLMDEQPFSVKSAPKELVSSVEDVPAISLIARMQEFVTPVEESDIEKVEVPEALMMQVKEVEASVQEARSLETDSLIAKSEVTTEEEDRHTEVPVVVEKEVLPLTVPDSESEVKEAPAVGRETPAEGDPGMESAIQSMIPHQSLLVESEPVELASSAEDVPAITEIAPVHDVVPAEVAIEESDKSQMIEASVMEKEPEAPVQDAGTPENDALIAEPDVTKEFESKFEPSSDVLISIVGKADTPVVQKEAVGASSLEFEVSSFEQQSSPVDDEYVELLSPVLSVPAIAETAAVKDDIPSEAGSSVEEFDLKGVDIGGPLVTEVKDVKGAPMEEPLPEQVEKPEAPVMEEEVKSVAETGAMEMELIKEAEAGLAAPEFFVKRKVPAVQDNTEFPSDLPEPLLEEKEALVVAAENDTETDTYMKQKTSLVDSEPVVLSSPFAGVPTIAEAAVDEEVSPIEVVDLFGDSNVGKVEVPDVLMVEEEVEAPAEEAGSSKTYSLIESDLSKEGRAGPAAPEVFGEEEVPVVQEKVDDLPSAVVAPASEGKGYLGVMGETEAVDISTLDFDRPRFELVEDFPAIVDNTPEQKVALGSELLEESSYDDRTTSEDSTASSEPIGLSSTEATEERKDEGHPAKYLKAQGKEKDLEEINVDLGKLDEVQSGVDHPVLVAGQQNLEPDEPREWTTEFQSSSENLVDSGGLEHSVENKVAAKTKGHLVDQTTVPSKEQEHFTVNKTANEEPCQALAPTQSSLSDEKFGNLEHGLPSKQAVQQVNEINVIEEDFDVHESASEVFARSENEQEEKEAESHVSALEVVEILNPVAEEVLIVVPKVMKDSPKIMKKEVQFFEENEVELPSPTSVEEVDSQVVHEKAGALSLESCVPTLKQQFFSKDSDTVMLASSVADVSIMVDAAVVQSASTEKAQEQDIPITEAVASTLELPLIGSKLTMGVDADHHAASVVVAAEEAPLIQEKGAPIAAEGIEVAPALKAKATDAGEKTKLVEEPVHVGGNEADKVEESETLPVEGHETKPQVAASKCEEVLNEDCEAPESEVLTYDCVTAPEAEDVSVVLEKAGFPLVELELRSEEKEMTISEENPAPGELEHRGLLGAEKSQIVQEVQEKDAHVERTQPIDEGVEGAEKKNEAVEGPEQDFPTLRSLNVAHDEESSRDEKFQESVDFLSAARAQRRLSFENEEIEFGAPLSPHRRRGFEATDILFRSRLGRGHPTHRHSAPDCLGTYTWVQELPPSSHQEKHRIHKKMKYKRWSESSEGGDGKKSSAKPGRSYSTSVADSGEPCMGEFEGLLKSWKERDKTTLHTSVASSARFSPIAASSADIVRQIREEIITIQRIIGQEIPPQCSLWKEVEILTQIVGMELPYMGDVPDLTKARQGLDLLKVVVGITCT